MPWTRTTGTASFGREIALPPAALHVGDVVISHGADLTLSMAKRRLLVGDGPQQGRSILGIRSRAGRQYASHDLHRLGNFRRTSCREFARRADGLKCIGNRRSRAAV